MEPEDMRKSASVSLTLATIFLVASLVFELTEQSSFAEFLAIARISCGLVILVAGIVLMFGPKPK